MKNNSQPSCHQYLGQLGVIWGICGMGHVAWGMGGLGFGIDSYLEQVVLRVCQINHRVCVGLPGLLLLLLAWTWTVDWLVKCIGKLKQTSRDSWIHQGRG